MTWDSATGNKKDIDTF